MRVLRIASAASEDLVDISEFLDTLTGSSRATENILMSIAKRLDYLLESPLMGNSREELGPGYRSVVANGYIIYYRFTQQEIIVLRIAHGSRLAENLFAAP